MSGDDYGDEHDTHLMPAARWNSTFGGFRGAVALHKANHWGVISALRRWSEENQVILHVTWSHDCYRWPAWYFVKPFK